MWGRLWVRQMTSFLTSEGIQNIVKNTKIEGNVMRPADIEDDPIFMILTLQCQFQRQCQTLLMSGDQDRKQNPQKQKQNK